MTMLKRSIYMSLSVEEKHVSKGKLQDFILRKKKNTLPPKINNQKKTPKFENLMSLYPLYRKIATREKELKDL